MIREKGLSLGSNLCTTNFRSQILQLYSSIISSGKHLAHTWAHVSQQVPLVGLHPLVSLRNMIFCLLVCCIIVSSLLELRTQSSTEPSLPSSFLNFFSRVLCDASLMIDGCLQLFQDLVCDVSSSFLHVLCDIWL